MDLQLCSLQYILCLLLVPKRAGVVEGRINGNTQINCLGAMLEVMPAKVGLHKLETVQRTLARYPRVGWGMERSCMHYYLRLIC